MDSAPTKDAVGLLLTDTAGLSLVEKGSGAYDPIGDNDFTDGFNAGTTGISDTAKGAHKSIGDDFP